MKFSIKLDRLPETVAKNAVTNVSGLSTLIRGGLQRVSYAVGSGGSAISAEYFAHCRRSLGAAPTIVQTPMEFTLNAVDFKEADVWLFSAGGSNPDILAAAEALRHNRPNHVVCITTKNGSRLQHHLEAFMEVVSHTVEVSDRDGFLSTHSLIGTVTALLRASNQALSSPVLQLPDAWVEEAGKRLSIEARKAIRSALGAPKTSDIVIVISDPRLAAAAVTVDTCLWEAAICPVQRTDFRNFAHGRHAWLHTRGANTVIIALTGIDSAESWHVIRTEIPTELRTLEFTFGNCGRFDCALAIIDCLVLVEAFGLATSVDPGKPDLGSFAHAIYEDTSLFDNLSRRTAGGYLKRKALIRRDTPEYRKHDLGDCEAELYKRFENAAFGAIILDYDGTIIPSKERDVTPDRQIVQELTRLLENGLKLGIATGRGGSVGRMLSQVLPKEFHKDIIVGYYNGSILCSLAEPLDDSMLRDPEGILRVAMEWLQNRLGVQKDKIRPNQYQLTVFKKHMPNIDFTTVFSEMFSTGELKLTESDHSFDILSASACKTNVVKKIEATMDISLATICLGDSGGYWGNDFILLGGPFGISVGQVCDRTDTCWSFWGADINGPQALVRILRALQGFVPPGAKLNLSNLKRDG